MKVKNLQIKNHAVLGSLELDFCDRNGDALDSIVIVGANGAGKTSLLDQIFRLFHHQEDVNGTVELSGKLAKILKKDSVTFGGKGGSSKSPIETSKALARYVRENQGLEEIMLLSSVVYNPIFPRYTPHGNERRKQKHFEYSFLRSLGGEGILSVSEFVKSFIESRVFKFRNTPPSRSEQKAVDEINNLFEGLELNTILKGLDYNAGNQAVFETKRGDRVDISKLSSGEKELFIRTLMVKFANPNNSVIIVDEPDLSLHPKWQQKILRVYKKIGENNQIIFATHSPHVMSAAPRDSVRLLYRNKSGLVRIKKLDETPSSYGKDSDDILLNVMGLSSTRSLEMEGNLLEARKLISQGSLEKAKCKLDELLVVLGGDDRDLDSLRFEYNRKQKGIIGVKPDKK